MSLQVAFYFEDWVQHIGASEPKTTLHKWCHNMKALGVDKIWMIDSTTFNIGQYYVHKDSEIEFELVQNLEEIESKISGDVHRVYLEIVSATDDRAASTNMLEFVHPQNALYVVGRDTSSIEYLLERSGDNCSWVHIPMVNERYSFYADTAVCVALFHRMCKIDTLQGN